MILYIMPLCGEVIANDTHPCLAPALEDVAHLVPGLHFGQLLWRAGHFFYLVRNAFDQLTGCSDAYHLTLFHHQNLVGDGFDVADNVGSQQDDPVPGHTGNEVADTDALFRVKTSGRLVQDDHLGISQKSLGKQRE